MEGHAIWEDSRTIEVIGCTKRGTCDREWNRNQFRSDWLATASIMIGYTTSCRDAIGGVVLFVARSSYGVEFKVLNDKGFLVVLDYIIILCSSDFCGD